MLTVVIFLGKILSSQTNKRLWDYLHCFIVFKELFHAHFNPISCALKSVSLFKLSRCISLLKACKMTSHNHPGNGDAEVFEHSLQMAGLSFFAAPPKLSQVIKPNRLPTRKPKA